MLFSLFVFIMLNYSISVELNIICNDQCLDIYINGVHQDSSSIHLNPLNRDQSLQLKIKKEI